MSLKDSPAASPEQSHPPMVNTEGEEEGPSPEDGPKTQELREALLKSVEVARAGQREKPPIDPPARLKQILAFKKFSGRALEQVREIVEADDEFRERTAASAAEGEIGRIGWLWLTRPDGWRQECRQLASVAEQESEQAAHAQRRQGQQQRLQRAEASRQKADAQRDRATRERDEARLQAAQARTESHRAEDKAAQLAAELEQARAALDSAQTSLTQSQRTRRRLDEKLKNAQTHNEQLKKDLKGARSRHEEEINSLTNKLADVERRLAVAEKAGFEAQPEPAPGADSGPEPPTKRLPVPMPKGLLNDTPEAVEYLLHSVPEVVVLIDGYNVTFKKWPEMTLREQRRRFLRNVEELSSRYPCSEFVVVFDGSVTDYDYIATTPRSVGVSVQFTPSQETADDRIIALCSGYPLRRPLVVVSEDNDVRERARGQGANLVHPRKLLTVMGLEVEDPDGWSMFGHR